MSFLKKKKNDDFILPIDSDVEFGKMVESSDFKPDILTVEEVVNLGKEAEDTPFNSGALEALKKRILKSEETEEPLKTAVATAPSSAVSRTVFPTARTTEEEKTQENKSGLMDKCLPYFIDDEGKDTSDTNENIYRLQSVADILRAEREASIRRISEEYGIPVGEIQIPDFEEFEVTQEPEEVMPAPKEAEKPPIIPESKSEPEITEKNDGETKPFLIISDIDGTTSSFPKIQTNPPESFETVTFTPIAANPSEPYITVTTKTQQIDLTGELVKIPETVPEASKTTVKLQENEFDEYIPETEPTDKKAVAKLIRDFSLKKRNYFIKTILSFFLSLILGLAKLPVFSGVILEYTATCMIVFSGLTGLAVLLNIDMFKDIIRLFRKSSGPDCAAALASVTTLVYAVFAINSGEIITDTLLMLCLILSFRSLSCFRKLSYMISNYRIINASAGKKALKLINDPAVTFSMAKDSVEGDTLIAIAQKTENITDFMKYSTFGSFLSGRMPFINGASLILSLISGLACAIYFEAAVYGLYAAAAIQCFSALPIIFFIDTLPLYSAAKKLNRMGAMIAGKAGAEQIEKANAAVLSSTDLFPEGTITLHQMKVLSDNSLDDTLIRAASLTKYMSSPLAPKFKSIVKSGNISTLPDTDTVKYEDRLGISGWVDNRLLFIGNRTLMETHGIEVPSVEVDRKILRQGFFPVYVATRDKACALLVIQYSVNPTVAKELRRLTGLGVTLLINNTDPNLTEEMICDYLGLYNDSVKVMSAAGCHMYKNVSGSIKSLSAPAAYKNRDLSLAAILNCASRIKRSNILLTACFVICAVLGAIIFAYTSFGGSGGLINDTVILVYSIVCTVLTYLIYLIEKP